MEHSFISLKQQLPESGKLIGDLNAMFFPMDFAHRENGGRQSFEKVLLSIGRRCSVKSKFLYVVTSYGGTLKC